MDYKQMGKFLFAQIIKKYNLNDDKIINLQEYINKKKLFNQETITFLLEAMEDLPVYKKELIIDYLLELYVSSHKEDTSVTKYIVETSQKDLYAFFNENEYFRNELFTNYFACVNSGTWDLTKEDKKEEVKEEKKPAKKEEIQVELLPDMIRRAYDYIVDSMYSRGADFSAISEFILLTLDEPGTVMAEDPRVAECFDFLQSNIIPLIRIMFADDYLLFQANNEDGSCQELIDYIIECAADDDYDLPDDDEMAQEFLEYFMLAVSDNETRLRLKREASTDDLDLYNEINPFNILEDLDRPRG